MSKLQKQIESELKSFDKELKELILKEFTEEIDKIDPG